MELILKYHRCKLHHLKVTALMLGVINAILGASTTYGLFSILFLFVVIISFFATAILLFGSLFDVIKDSLGLKQFDAGLNKVLGIAIMVTAVTKFLFDSYRYDGGAYYASILSSLFFYGPIHLLIGWELREGKWDPERMRPINILLEFKLKCSEVVNDTEVNAANTAGTIAYHTDPPPRYGTGECVVLDLNKGQVNPESGMSQI